MPKYGGLILDEPSPFASQAEWDRFEALVNSLDPEFEEVKAARRQIEWQAERRKEMDEKAAARTSGRNSAG